MNEPNETAKSAELPPSLKEELVLTENEFGLFELMRDGVVQSLTCTPHDGHFHCTVNLSHDDHRFRIFSSHSSALDAFMKARVEIITAKIEGNQIYTAKALKKRKELGLS